MRISDWSSDVCSSDLQNVSAGTDKRQRRVGLARCHCRHDVDARIDGAIVVRRPAHEGEDRAWTEGDDARAAVDDRVSRDARSDERSVGKECVSKWKYRWSPYN